MRAALTIDSFGSTGQRSIRFVVKVSKLSMMLKIIEMKYSIELNANFFRLNGFNLTGDSIFQIEEMIRGRFVYFRTKNEIILRYYLHRIFIKMTFQC